jgi:hypothetical protein
MKQTIIYRAENCEIAEALARYRECAAQAVELLSLPPPDTFLGRQHNEPSPLPDMVELEASRIEVGRLSFYLGQRRR